VVEAHVSKLLGPFQIQPGGMNTYQEHKRSSSKAVLAWTDGRKEAWLSLNGDSCDLVPVEQKREFLRTLKGLGVKATRIDLAADFPRETLSLSKVHAAAKRGNVRHFRRYDPRRPVRDMVKGLLEGNQASFGRRGGNGSGKYVRFYDKKLESDGLIDAIRFECEFSAEGANLIFDDLCEADTDDAMCGIIARRLGGAIDFVDRAGSHGHRARQDRLSWWQRIIDLLGEAPIRITRSKTTLQKAAEWHKKQYRKTIAKVKRVAEEAGMKGRAVVQAIVAAMLFDGERDLDDEAWLPGPGDDLDFAALLRPKPVFC
jgi:DNA relaxase NicK